MSEGIRLAAVAAVCPETTAFTENANQDENDVTY